MKYLRYKPFFLAVEKLREQACTREIYSRLGLSEGRAGSIGPLIMIRSGLSNLTLKPIGYGHNAQNYKLVALSDLLISRGPSASSLVTR